VGQSGLLIGTEVFSLGGDADASELLERIPAFYGDIGKVDQLPYVVVHEFDPRAQFLEPQSPTCRDGDRARDQRLQAGLDRQPAEGAVSAFAQDLQAAPDGINLWLYNYGRVGPDTPADLGYYLGAAQPRGAARNGKQPIAPPCVVPRFLK